jgi:Cu(I)/Ag(I) efflux system protein CusF
MKQVAALSLALVLSIAIPVISHAQSGDMKGMDTKSMDGMKMDPKSMSKGDKGQASHKATGVVKSTDRNKGTVTLAHDPVPSLKWPAMTMSFAVKDKAMLDKLPANKKVDFEFVQQGKDYVITAVK